MKEWLENFWMRYHGLAIMGSWFLIAISFMNYLVYGGSFLYVVGAIVLMLTLGIFGTFKQKGWLFKEIWVAGNKQDYKRQNEAIYTALPMGMDWIFKKKMDKLVDKDD